MFRQSSNNKSNPQNDHESAEPLLGSHSPDRVETVFAVDDDEDDYGHDTSSFEANGVAKNDTGDARGGHTVRFEDTVQIIAPPLRSTYASRETGMYVSRSVRCHMYLHGSLTFTPRRI